MDVMAKRLKAARAASELSQETVAAACGVSRSAVAQWEREGGTKPRVETLITLADLYGQSSDYLIGIRSKSTGEKGPKSRHLDAARKLSSLTRTMQDAIISLINEAHSLVEGGRRTGRTKNPSRGNNPGARPRRRRGAKITLIR